MILRHAFLGLGICLTVAVSTSPSTVLDARLTAEQAQQYLLELINKDRAALGKGPVELDAVASRVAKKQSEEMVRLAAMSHVDSSGRLPVQRYTEAGGRDRVRENVALICVRAQLTEPIETDPNPTFTREEVESVEAAYFNEVPPNDGHRKNVLYSEHTHVGIALARGAGEDARVIGNAEEFVDRYIDELSALPETVKLGEVVPVEGRLGRGSKISAVGIARGPAPGPVDRTQFKAVGHYSVPAPYVKYWAGEQRDGVSIHEKPDGRFSVKLPLSDSGNPGLYYVSIWVHDSERGDVLASVRTILVKPVSVGQGE